MHTRPLATQDRLPLGSDSDLVPLMALPTTRLLFLAQLGDLYVFHFEHCYDNLSSVREPQLTDRPSLGLGRPLLQ